MFRSGNPALKADTFTGVRAFGEGTMTLEGSVNKTGISLVVLIATAALQWNGVFGEAMPVALLAGVVGGFGTGYWWRALNDGKRKNEGK
jgi:uncharacterized YccA/Bax inhibitor family protein